jgi:hypothetical protein
MRLSSTPPQPLTSAAEIIQELTGATESPHFGHCPTMPADSSQHVPVGSIHDRAECISVLLQARTMSENGAIPGDDIRKRPE